MLTSAILIASIIFQLVAVYLALRLIKVTGNIFSWISIAIAICFMAVVRIILLTSLFSGKILAPYLTFSTIVGFLISVFMVVGLLGVGKIFRAAQVTLNQLKNVENALRKNEEQLQMVLDSTNDGFYDWDLNTGSIYFSPRYCTMLGYEPDELISSHETRKSLVHPDDVDEVEKAINNCIAGNTPSFSKEYRVKTKKGEWLWIQSREKIVEFDEKGKPVRMVGTHMDINERKLTEKKLHATLESLAQSEEKLRLKLDYILSPDANIEEKLELTDIYDREYLQEMQDAFAEANEVASIITDVEGNPITNPSNFSQVCMLVRGTKEGLKRCIMSDKKLGEKAEKLMKPTYEQCHSCGFADASAPIIVGGRHIANWLIGQTNPMRMTEEHIEKYAEEIEADKDKMVKAFRAMPKMTQSRFEKVLDLLWLFAKELSTMGFNNFNLTRELEQRKLAEKELSGAAERYRALIVSSNTGAWEYHNDTGYLWCSPEYFTMLGRESKEYDLNESENLQEIWLDLIHPEDQDKARQVFDNYLKNPEGMYENRFRMKHKEGHWVSIWARGKTIRDEDGNITARTIGTHIDVSGLKT